MDIRRIGALIYVVRGQRVMLDRDLAALYGVETGNLNKAVNRNLGRFPDDFMFQLTAREAENLRFQIGISSWGGRRICRGSSRSRAWLCCRAFCAANGRL